MDINIRHYNANNTMADSGEPHEKKANFEPPKMLFWWRAASRWALILLAGLAPIFFLPLTDIPVAANKEILVFILILAALFAFLGRVLIEGKIRYPGHLISSALAILVLVWGVSAFFSINQIGSLIGSWGTPDSFFSILLFVILASVTAMTFNRRDIIFSLTVFLASLSILGIFELFQLLKIFILPFNFSRAAVFNPIGSVNDLGVLLAFGLVIALGLITPTQSPPYQGGEKEGVGTYKILKKLLGLAILIFLANLIVIDFWAIWVGIALAMIFMISFLSAGLRSVSESPSSIRRTEEFAKGEGMVRRIIPGGSEIPVYQGIQLAYFQKAWLPSIILLISILLLFVPSPLARFIQTPLEVSPNFNATFNVAFENFKSGHYLFGSGPSTFRYVFNLYKPIGINQTIFWSTVFNYGASALATWAVTTGIFGVLALLFLIAAFVWRGLSVFGKGKTTPTQPPLTPPYKGGETGEVGGEKEGVSGGVLISQSLFVAVIFLFLMWFLYVVSFTAMAFAFFGVGLFLAASLVFKTPTNLPLTKGEKEEGVLPYQGGEKGGVKSVFREYLIFTSPPKTFLFSLLIVGLMIGAAIGIYFEANRYIAELYFSKAVAASTQNKSEIATDVFKAIQFWPYDERYFQAISQAVFLQINDLLARKDLPQETLRAQFQNLTSNTIAYAQKARELNPQNPLNAVFLGSIYENLIPFIPDAANFALSSYGAAVALDPQNPSDRLALARVEIAKANSAIASKASNDEINNSLNKAIADLETAINLKSDYAPARFLEVQIYDRQGKLTDAIKRAEELVTLNNSDVGTLFQLGFLYYKASRFDESRQVLAKTVELSPNYSNARYFLGLIYDKNGLRDRAIEQFSKIAELNPDNSEVKQIIANLKAKKPALFGIAPPAPQNRSEAPISEGMKTPTKPLKK